jgi:hypothetical protein
MIIENCTLSHGGTAIGCHKIILRSGRVIPYWGPFTGKVALEISELSNPPVTAQELRELANEFNTLADWLEADAHAIKAGKP